MIVPALLTATLFSQKQLFISMLFRFLSVLSVLLSVSHSAVVNTAVVSKSQKWSPLLLVLMELLLTIVWARFPTFHLFLNSLESLPLLSIITPQTGEGSFLSASSFLKVFFLSFFFIPFLSHSATGPLDGWYVSD